MYIGVQKVRSHSEEDGMVTFQMKDGKEYTYKKELFDLIATDEVKNNGETPHDVVIFTMASMLVHSLSKYGITIFDSITITERTVNLITVFRDNAIAKKFNVKDTTDILLEDIID